MPWWGICLIIFVTFITFAILHFLGKKQAPVQTLSAFNDFGSGNIVCGQSDGSFYGRNFAHKPFITFGINNRRNTRSNAYARS